jgi:tail tube protein
MSISTEIGSITYRQIGSRDFYALIKTGEEYSFEVTYNPIGVDLIKRGIDLPNGTGTIEKSLTILMSFKLNNVENYIMFKGAVTNNIEVEISNDAAIEVTQEFFCRDITVPATTHGLTTPTFAATPTAAPWTHLSPGSGPFTFHGASTDVDNFNFSVNHNLTRVKPTGELTAKFVGPTLRDIEWEFNTWFKDTFPISETKALTPGAMAYKLASVADGSHQVSFTDAYSEAYETSFSTSSTDFTMLTLSGRAKSATLNTYP